MDMDQIRQLYDRELRMSVEYAGVRCEQTPFVTRMINEISRGGVVMYSRLDAATADNVIREQITYFKNLDIAERMSWKLYDYDQPADLKDRLIAAGFTANTPSAVLILDLQAIPTALLDPVTHDIRRLTDPDQLGDVLAVLNGVYPGEDYTWSVDTLTETLRQKPEQMSVYAAYADGQPVTAAWIDYPSASFAGLWGGATLPAYRKRGLYTALVSARVQEAKARGIRFLTIDASPASRAVLEKFGFRLMAYAWECNYSG
jgi:GNAT superfamily N-acetyltransferase